MQSHHSNNRSYRSYIGRLPEAFDLAISVEPGPFSGIYRNFSPQPNLDE